MSCDPIKDFDVLLQNKEVDHLIEELIKDQAFSIEFLTSCVAHYYLTELRSLNEKEGAR